MIEAEEPSLMLQLSEVKGNVRQLGEECKSERQAGARQKSCPNTRGECQAAPGAHSAIVSRAGCVYNRDGVGGLRSPKKLQPSVWSDSGRKRSFFVYHTLKERLSNRNECQGG